MALGNLHMLHNIGLRNNGDMIRWVDHGGRCLPVRNKVCVVQHNAIKTFSLKEKHVKSSEYVNCEYYDFYCCHKIYIYLNPE